MLALTNDVCCGGEVEVHANLAVRTDLRGDRDNRACREAERSNECAAVEDDCAGVDRAGVWAFVIDTNEGERDHTRIVDDWQRAPNAIGGLVLAREYLEATNVVAGLLELTRASDGYCGGNGEGDADLRAGDLTRCWDLDRKSTRLNSSHQI